MHQCHFRERINFRFVDTRIPRIEDNAIRVKLAFFGSPDHVPEMIIFDLSIFVGTIDPDHTYNRPVSEIDIPPEGKVVHLRQYG